MQGCCRDHTLFCVGVLRHHGIPARSRVGFASYFRDDWNHDHVIVEVEQDGRWVRFDPELEPGSFPLDPHDMDAGPDAPFLTAADLWQGHRRDGSTSRRSASTSTCRFAASGSSGRTVLLHLAHRYKDEVLLWDGWGVMGTEADEGANEPVDEIAPLLVAADAGDEAAEAQLLEH